MEHITLQQTADFLENATIEQTVEYGHAIVHFGVSEAGSRFVLMNDCNGETVLNMA